MLYIEWYVYFLKSIYYLYCYKEKQGQSFFNGHPCLNLFFCLEFDFHHSFQ